MLVLSLGLRFIIPGLWLKIHINSDLSHHSSYNGLMASGHIPGWEDRDKLAGRTVKAAAGFVVSSQHGLMISFGFTEI